MPKQTSPLTKPAPESVTQEHVPNPDDHEHVPEMAENFEHTLRRLIRQRDKDRAENAGLYR